MRTAMPCPVARHDSALPCPPPTDPTGFIYPSYQAAQTETQRDKPSSKSSHQDVAYLSSSVGGSVTTLSFEDTNTNNRLSSHRRLGGGTRDRVRGFSRASRRNLLLRLASINRRAFRAFKGRMIFVTLTYPHVYPEEPELCKRHLKALRKRLQRKFEPFAAFWRLGIQERGAWHFHLLLFVGRSMGSVTELRRFISASWFEVAGKVSEGHLHAGTRSCSRAEMERGHELRRALHGQARGVSRGTTNRQDLGDMERGPTARPVGDGCGQHSGRLQDQKDLQETGEEKG
jgi:hypothetical protein